MEGWKAVGKAFATIPVTAPTSRLDHRQRAVMHWEVRQARAWVCRNSPSPAGRGRGEGHREPGRAHAVP
jgi:hypothetical protein